LLAAYAIYTHTGAGKNNPHPPVFTGLQVVREVYGIMLEKISVYYRDEIEQDRRLMYRHEGCMERAYPVFSHISINPA